jgi:alpha-ketoglutarate-dependent taurine dioxygenase
VPDAQRPRPALRRREANERAAMRVTGDRLVSVEAPSGVSPVSTICATMEGVALSGWAAANRAAVTSLLATHGVILFRNFQTSGAQDFAQLVRAVSGEPLEYRERSSPRSHVSDRIYTSTEYPSDQPIFLHNENSYAHTWPLTLFFLCVVPPALGGETPFADCRRVYRALPDAIREQFVRRGVLYVRNFGEGLGLPWQTAFGTGDRSRVEAQLRASGYEFEWLGAGRLRTKRLGPAVARHPRTGDLSWFNHATFFHVSTLPPEMGDALRAQFREEDLPNNTYYGDGSAIEPAVLETLRQCYLDAKHSIPWRAGDVLMLDNVLVAHGREPYSGPREIRVAMSEPCAEDAISVRRNAERTS